MLYEFQLYKDPVFGGAVVDPSPLLERANGLVGKDTRGVGRRCCRGSVGNVSPGSSYRLVHLLRCGNVSVAIFYKINNVDPDLFLLIVNRSSNSEILLKQTVFVVYGADIGNSNAVDVSGPGVIVDCRFGKIGIGFGGAQMKNGFVVFIRLSAFPILDYCDLLCDGFIRNREIIPVGSICVCKQSRILCKEIIKRLVVDENDSVHVDCNSVVSFIKREPFGSFYLSENIAAGFQTCELYKTVAAGSLFAVVVTAVQFELGAGNFVSVGFVVLPESQRMIRIINYCEHPVLFIKREYNSLSFVVVYRYFAGFVTFDLELFIQKDIIRIGGGLDQVVSTFFKVSYANDTVASRTYGHIYGVAVIRLAGDKERYIRQRSSIILAVYVTMFIEIEVAVDTRRVAECPYAVFISDNKISVYSVRLVCFAFGYYDGNYTVLVDNDRHFGVILQIIVYAVNFLEAVCTSGNIGKVYFSE